MANTFELISSVTVGSGGAASIDFTSIPATFTDLCVKLSTRSTAAGVGQDEVNVTFNGSTSSYTWRNILGNGSTTASQNGATAYIRLSALSPTSGTTANTFSSAELYIPNYAGSSYKSVSVDMASEQNATATYMGVVAGLWSDSTAINRVTLTGAAANLAQYTTAYLYGVKNA